MDEETLKLKKSDVIKHFKMCDDDRLKLFRYCDITPLFKSPEFTKIAVDLMVHELSKKNWEYDLIAGIEGLGFILGILLAQRLNVGFLAIRKKGKLAGEIINVPFRYEYGEDILEIQQDSDLAGKRIVILDDILATGGTTVAAIELLKKVESKVVGCVYLGDAAYAKKVKKLDCELCFVLQ